MKNAVLFQSFVLPNPTPEKHQPEFIFYVKNEPPTKRFNNNL
jgi:hypothetical protein